MVPTTSPRAGFKKLIKPRYRFEHLDYELSKPSTAERLTISEDDGNLGIYFTQHFDHVALEYECVKHSSSQLLKRDMRTHNVSSAANPSLLSE